MYQVEIIHKKDLIFQVNSGAHEFCIDAKGHDGITPPDTLLASLGSCIGVYISKYSQGAKLGLENFSVTIEAEFTKEPPMRFERIDVVIDLKGIVLDERRRGALLQFIKNCPVHNTIEGNPAVEVKLSECLK